MPGWWVENAILCDGVGEHTSGALGGLCFDPQVVRPGPVADDMILCDSAGLRMRKYGGSAGST